MRKRFVLLSLALVAVSSLVVRLSADPGPCIPIRFFKWGLMLQSDKAFYAVGDTARVDHGVYNFTNTDLDLFSSDVTGNYAYNSGGGVYSYYYSTSTIYAVDLSDNTSRYGYGGGIYFYPYGGGYDDLTIQELSLIHI